jgi:amidophosphoribosyltransferase
VYGIDMPSKDELIAHGRTVEQITSAIGADWLVFQDLKDLIEAVRRGNQSITTFDCSVFTGEYVSGGVSGEYLDRLERARNDSAKEERRSGDRQVIDLYNSA